MGVGRQVSGQWSGEGAEKGLRVQQFPDEDCGLLAPRKGKPVRIGIVSKHQGPGDERWMRGSLFLVVKESSSFTKLLSEHLI